MKLKGLQAVHCAQLEVLLEKPVLQTVSSALPDFSLEKEQKTVVSVRPGISQTKMVQPAALHAAQEASLQDWKTPSVHCVLPAVFQNRKVLTNVLTVELELSLQLKVLQIVQHVKRASLLTEKVTASVLLALRVLSPPAKVLITATSVLQDLLLLRQVPLTVHYVRLVNTVG